MLLSRLLADFTRGESDTLRKAMGKKQKDKLDKLKPKFINGGQKNGHDATKLEKIWADWEKFASYAFNKSHATCYSWVAYQTAYLKAHFPAQYMAGNMSRNLDNITEIRKLMDECKSMGINTLGPDVNESKLKFAVNHNGDIRFGMAAVKGVGKSAVQAILEEREKNGPFTSVFDFFERVNLAACNRKSVESLILAGAFDGFNSFPREAFFAKQPNSSETYVETLIRFGNSYQADKQQQTHSLFGDLTMEVEVAHPEPPKDVVLWSDLERLNQERDLVGIYLSAHPLDEYAVILKHYCTTNISKVQSKDESLRSMESIKFGGIVSGRRVGTSKSGNAYGIIKMEDFENSGEIALFGQDWLKWQHFFVEGTALYITAKLQGRRYAPNALDLVILDIQLLSEVRDTLVKRIVIDVPVDRLDVPMVESLAEIVRENPGNTELCFNINAAEDLSVNLRSASVHLNVNRRLLDFIESNEGISYRLE